MRLASHGRTDRAQFNFYEMLEYSGSSKQWGEDWLPVKENMELFSRYDVDLCWVLQNLLRG